MNAQKAITLAASIKRIGPISAVEHALVALLDHGDEIQAPGFEMLVRMLGANIHAQGKTYLELAVDPVTKEVGHSFEVTKRDPLELETSSQIRTIVSDLLGQAYVDGIKGTGDPESGREKVETIMRIADGLLEEIVRLRDVVDDTQKKADDAIAARDQALAQIELLRSQGWQLPHG